MFLSNFPKILKSILKGLPKNDYPVLNTFLCLVGIGEAQVEVRVVSFCNLENHSEYRLATNLPETEVSNEEIGEIYRKRWGIETLWKFLKMHLKLDKFMNENTSDIH